jgi:hypothetical protein
MTRFLRVLFGFLFSLIAAGAFAQQPQVVQLAGLRPSQELALRRVSPTAEKPDGPVLYQLVFTPGTPGTIARFDTNPRHLVNSDITDNGSTVAIGNSGFMINVSSGMVNFVNGQAFPGTVTSVASGAGLTGGPITAIGTLSLDTNFTNNLYSRLAAANTFTTGTQLIQTGAANMVGLAVQAASAQTANLEEWRNNGGTAVAWISAGGKFSGDGSGLTNLSNSQLVDGNLLQHKAALLQWYRQDYFVGGLPRTAAFDGTNVWVTNSFDGTVRKLRATDGAVLGTFAVGNSPDEIAFDGANIWVTNNVDGTVSKLRASDGAQQGGPFAVGTAPIGIAFDGANIWVANEGSNTVSKLRASDGAQQGGPFAVGTNPFGIAFDGANVWVTNMGSSNVSKLRASDGALLGTFNVGSSPRGLAFDGANIWVANNGNNNVSELRASDGTVLGTLPVDTTPRGVAFDGANIWVVNNGANTVSKLSSNATNGTIGLVVDPQGNDNGTMSSGGANNANLLLFGSGTVGEGIGSQRTTNGGGNGNNQFGLDFYTNFTNRMFIDNSGTVHVVGSLTKGGGSFLIDHPLDPANKYLSHSFVESPDMKNVYDGIVVLNPKGQAWVELPDYFQALNMDFRYQLTPIGNPGQHILYIAKEISGNRFKIAGGKPGAKVSWQVTGIRHDAYANAHRIRVEEDKGEKRGTYLHPELFEKPAIAAAER